MTTKTLEPDEIVAGLKRNDPAAVDEFVRQYSRSLFGVILNYTRNPSDAEEILQDTLLKIIAKIETFRAESDIWPWVKRIAINNSIMWLRKHSRRQAQTSSLDEVLPHFSNDGEFEQAISGWSVNPEDVLLNSEMGEELYEAVQSLPAEYRMPLVLKDIEGFSIKEIAAVLNLKEATTKTRIHRARLFLRDKLARYLEGRS